MDSKRTEKLVSALYLLTSFFDEKEPMKWRLRELGGKLISQYENKNFVLEIVSLLRVAKNVNLLSDTNFEIIHREFSNLLTGETISGLLKREEEIPAIQKPEKLESKPDYIGSSVSTRTVIKDKPKESGVTLKKDNRQTTIIGLLKKKNEIMIKDVTPLIPGVSEKTIQRELLSMVLAGILRKMGEKRWSRYALAN